MSKYTERANYLKGLMEGMKLSTEKDANRLLIETVKLAADLADALAGAERRLSEVEDLTDALDEDLSVLESIVEDSDDEEWDEDGEYDEDDDEDEDADDEDDEDAEKGAFIVSDDAETVDYICPSCGKTVTLRLDEVDFEEDMPCPFCGAQLFPESMGEDDEADEEDDDEDSEEADEDDGEAEDAQEEVNILLDTLFGESEE